MKIITLTLKMLIDLFYNEKLTCSLFLISFIITITSFFYFYGLYNGIKSEQEQLDISTRSYLLNTQNVKDPNTVLKLLRDGKYFNPEMVKLLSEEYEKDNKKFRFTASYPKSIKYFIIQGRYFNEKEYNSNSYIAIIGFNLLDPEKSSDYIGKKIKLASQTYKTIGIDKLFAPNMITIPFNTFLNEKYKIDNIEFIIDTKTSKASIDNFEKYINSLGLNAMLIKPKDVNYDIVNSFVSRLLLAILIITLSVINILYLFSYLVERRKKEYLVMKICGATSFKTIFTVLFELLILITIGYLTALFIILLVVKRLVENMNIKLEFNLIDYPIIFIIITFITIISAWPTIYKCRKNSSVLSLKN